MIYRTNFTLTASVIDFEAAHNYLIEDDMREYLKGDDRDCDKVTKIIWILEDERQGHIDVETTDYLTDEESARISDWISGQCSDGLGEGFEQQDFASYEDDENYYDENEEPDYIMASFDWETNNYELTLIG